MKYQNGNSNLKKIALFVFLTGFISTWEQGVVHF